MRGLPWVGAVVSQASLLLGCNGDLVTPPPEYMLPTGLYHFSLTYIDQSWGPALVPPSGQLEVHHATPDSLVIRWTNTARGDYPDTLQVAHFTDGAYRVTFLDGNVMGNGIAYSFWREDGAVRCEADPSPGEEGSPYACHLERTDDLPQ